MEEQKKLEQAEIEKQKQLDDDLKEQIRLEEIDKNTTDEDAVLKGTEDTTNPYGSDGIEKQSKLEEKKAQNKVVNVSSDKDKINSDSEDISKDKNQAKDENNSKNKVSSDSNNKLDNNKDKTINDKENNSKDESISKDKQKTEPKTEETTQAKTNGNTNNNSSNNDTTSSTPQDGDIKDGKTYWEGFGWVDGVAEDSGDVETPANFELTGNQIGH